MKKIIILLIILFLLSFSSCSLPAFEEAYGYLSSTANVQYTRDGNWHVFDYQPVAPTKGVIMYPGGLVDPVAYAPLCRNLAEQGYLVILTPMPFDMAIFNINEASNVIQRYAGQVVTWAIMGHSLGGAMACYYIRDHPGIISDLILLGSFASKETNLSASPIQVLNIWAEYNYGSNYDEQLTNAYLLPSGTFFQKIIGGNHSQFAYYGPQSGDGPATKSLEVQQSETVNHIDQFLLGTMGASPLLP